MVFTDHVTDHAGRLLVRLVPGVAQLVHGEQYASMYRLETVAYVGQCAPDDDAHRVVEIALTHLVFDVDAYDFFGEFCHQSASWISINRPPPAARFAVSRRGRPNPSMVAQRALKRQLKNVLIQ
jgi:hypothetical protein